MKPSMHKVTITNSYILFAIAFLMVVSMLIVSADAASIEGRVTFVGTMETVPDGDGFQATFRVRIRGQCEPRTPAGKFPDRDWWLHVTSGRMDGPLPLHGPNLINAYSTLLTALNSKRKVQINGVNHCQIDSQPLTERLWKLQIGIYN